MFIDVRQIAWDLLKARIKTKPSWGKNEVLGLMQDCLVEAFETEEGLRRAEPEEKEE